MTVCAPAWLLGLVAIAIAGPATARAVVDRRMARDGAQSDGEGSGKG